MGKIKDKGKEKSKQRKSRQQRSQRNNQMDYIDQFIDLDVRLPYWMNDRTYEFIVNDQSSRVTEKKQKKQYQKAKKIKKNKKNNKKHDNQSNSRDQDDQTQKQANSGRWSTQQSLKLIELKILYRDQKQFFDQAAIALNRRKSQIKSHYKKILSEKGGKNVSYEKLHKLQLLYSDFQRNANMIKVLREFEDVISKCQNVLLCLDELRTREQETENKQNSTHQKTNQQS